MIKKLLRRWLRVEPEPAPVALPFQLGSDVWPGLGKAVEEFGEVLQVLGKLIGNAGEPIHFDGTDLIAKLAEELPDATASIAVLHRLNPILHGHTDAMMGRADAKITQFEAWHDGLASRRA